jgi:hypothetical protein
VLIDEYSCGFVDHVNDYDEKFNNITIQEEDQRSIMIILGELRHSYQTTQSRSENVLQMQQQEKDNQW